MLQSDDSSFGDSSGVGLSVVDTLRDALDSNCTGIRTTVGALDSITVGDTDGDMLGEPVGVLLGALESGFTDGANVLL